MPSLEHNALVEIFRSNPALVPQLLRDVFGVPLPERPRLTVCEAALDQLAPVEFRADLIVELGDDRSVQPQLGAIVEVQLRADDDKRYTWPVYLAVDRSRRRCDTCLLIVAPDPAVAEWARRPIELGPGNRLHVFVLGPAQVPIVTDPAVVVANPQLAVLSAIAHGNQPEHGLAVLRLAVTALDALDRKDAEIYLHLIHKALGEPMRRALKEEHMLRERFPDAKLDLPEFYVKGLARSEARGEAHGKAAVLLKILEHAGLELTAEQRSSITTCEDTARIDVWVERAFTARTAAELFDAR